jgi:hypothetical protein
MYILYLDDSGSVQNAQEDYFVLGGICVPESSVRWLSYEIEKIAEEIAPNNPRSVEFHASEIFGGRNPPWSEYTNRNERIRIIKNVLHTLDNAYNHITTFACAIHKDSFPGQDAVLVAFEDLTSRFNMFINRIATENENREHGIIVMDKSSYETNLQNVAMRFRREGNRWGSYLKNVCEVPLFVDSKASRIIQLADHIAYAVFRRYNAKDTNYFDCIQGRFDQDDGVIHGLVHKQTVIPNCTCPACITRRQNNQ